MKDGGSMRQNWFDDFRNGAIATLPLTVAVAPIGMIFGVGAAAKGLSVAEAGLMSALVFAGGSQFVALDLWRHPVPWLALGLAALVVNIRHVLLSMSLGGKLQAFPVWLRYVAMLMLADEVWAMAEKRALVAPLTPAWYAGIAIPFYVTWLLATLAGAWLGSAIGDPRALGLDFAFTAVFIVLVVGFWKGRETGIVLAVSGLAAVAVHTLVPGAWYIAAGAAAGIAAATLQEIFWPEEAAE
jgi:4-azaleucine resistance transporter AzlC